MCDLQRSTIDEAFKQDIQPHGLLMADVALQYATERLN